MLTLSANAQPTDETQPKTEVNQPAPDTTSEKIPDTTSTPAQASAQITVPNTTDFGKKIIEVVTKGNLESFREFYIKRSDREWIIGTLSQISQKEIQMAKINKRLNEWFSHAQIESQSNWTEIQEDLKRVGVNLSTLEFSRVRENACKKKRTGNRIVVRCEDIMVYAISNLGEIHFKVDDPTVIERGWITTKHISYRE